MLSATASGALLPDPQEVLRCADLYRQLGLVPLATYTILGWTETGRPICSCYRKSDCANPGKHPIGAYKGIDTPDKGYMQVWNAVREAMGAGISVNLAVRAGSMSGIFVVDLDRKEGVDGIANFQRWLAAHNIDPASIENTMQAKSGGGGQHYIFLHPQDVELAPKNSAKEFGPGIDIKAGGSPFHVYPSLHKNGNQYQWTNWKPPIDAPEELWKTAQKKQVIAIAGEQYTPSLIEVKEYAEELAAKRSKPVMKTVGINMREALEGNAIAKEGGGHDAYRDLAFYLAKRWPTADADVLCSYFMESVQARLDEVPDSNTSYDDVLRGFQSALSKVSETASSWVGQLMLNDNGAPLPIEANMLLYFQHHPAWQGVLGYNERQNKPVYLRLPPLDNKPNVGAIVLARDRPFFALWFGNQARMAGAVREKDMWSALLGAAMRNSFDPLVEQLSALRGQWDGVPRLQTALQRAAGAPDDIWVRTIFPLWMKSLVARIMRPGSKVDTMLILEGKQGFKKSTFFSALMPDSSYFSDSLSKIRHDIESIRLIHSGPAIFELGELSGLRKHEVEDVKAFLSAFQDDLRPLYEPPRTVLRRSVFVGTTNRDDYLRDETGGRRFWPVKVNKIIDINLVLREREQWFAEALARFERGEIWWLENGKETALAQQEQDARYEEDIWEQPIQNWLADTPKVPKDGESTSQMAEEMNRQKAGLYVTVYQVAQYALKVELKNARNAEGARISKILRRLGWVPERFVDVDGSQRRGWRRPLSDMMRNE